MAEEKEGTVTLIAPNGVTVSVAESKLADRLRGDYQLTEERPSGRSSKSRSKK